MRKLMIALATAACAALGVHAAAAQQARTLVYASYLSPAQTIVQVDDWFMEEVKKRTEGRITFETYYGGALLKGPEIYPGTGRGAADIGNSAPGYNPNQFLSASVTLPFITDNVEAATKAYIDLYRTNEEVQREWEQNKLKLLYAFAIPENSFWSNKPVKSVEDLKGMRIRAVTAVAEALNVLGATPVAIAWPETIDVLQRKGIDALTSNAFDIAIQAGMHEVAPYGSDAGRMGIYALLATAMNLETWNKLDPETRGIMEAVAAEAPARYLDLVKEEVRKAATTLAAAKDIVVLKTPDAEIQRWRDLAAEKVWSNWVEKMNKAGYDGRKLLDEYIALVRKYEEGSTYVPGYQQYFQMVGQ